ncbi:MAG: beta-lactamase family protein [Phycisphaerales bacterium]|nr:MAG: beta-lactamase family protein [Phycisphaerales bacterium]
MFTRNDKHAACTGKASHEWPIWVAVCLAGMALIAGCASTLTAPPDSPTKQKGKTTQVDPTLSPQVSDARLQRVQKRLDKFCKANDIPGATFGMVLADGSSMAPASGVSDRTAGRVMKPTDRMLSGSIGKTYVSAVMLQLVEEGRVDLSSKISHWFGKDAWFPRLPNAYELTLRMLMTHTSGIPRHIFTPEFQAAVKDQPQKVWQSEELVAFVLDAEPLFPPGQGWSYADTNYILVGMIIERVTGRTFYEELADRILGPLELVDTSPSDHPCLRGLINGYSVEGNPFSIPPEVAPNKCYAINPQVEWTGGGLISTASDLARWAWLLYGGDVLKDKTLGQLLDGVVIGNDPQRKYGLGVMIRSSRRGPVCGHAGWMPGYVSLMAYYSDHRIALAVQVNTEVGVGLPQLESLLDTAANELLR